jgi:hypothetical protein
VSAPLLEPQPVTVHIVADCHGHDWLASPAQNTVWVLASDDHDELMATIADALAALRPRPRRHLHLVR